MALDYLPSPSWAVVYGETPSADRWSELGENDDALATGAGIDDDAILNRHIAPGAVTQEQTSGLWYEELGRTTLSTPGTSIAVVGMPARKNLRFIVRPTTLTGSTTITIRFNGDGGNNYGWQRSVSSGTDTNALNANSIEINTTSAPGFYIFDGRNADGYEKHFIGHTLRGAIGAGAAMARDEIIGKWAQTSGQITTISVQTSGANFGVGSELVVIGHD